MGSVAAELRGLRQTLESGVQELRGIRAILATQLQLYAFGAGCNLWDSEFEYLGREPDVDGTFEGSEEGISEAEVLEAQTYEEKWGREKSAEEDEGVGARRRHVGSIAPVAPFEAFQPQGGTRLALRPSLGWNPP